MKKITFLAAFLMLSAAAVVADDFVVDGVKYTTINENQVYVAVQNNDFTRTTLVVPDSVTYEEKKYEVNYIARKAFESCQTLQSATIGAKGIRDNAFIDCSNLASVTLSEGVEYIQDGVFSGTAIATLHLPASLNSFGSNSIYSTIAYCQNLTSFTVAEGSYYYCAVDGVLYSKDKKTLIYWPLGKSDFNGFSPEITTLRGGAFISYTFTVDTLVIPAFITNYTDAFNNSTIQHLVIESAAKSDNSFQGATIKSITLGKNVTYIGQLHFIKVQGCESITILSETMPDWQYGTNTSWPCFASYYDMFSTPLYVPCGMAATYAADENKWANFTNISEIFTHKFAATSADKAKGTVTIVTAPACDVDAQIKAEAKEGFAFKQWSDGNTEATRTLTVDQDTSLVAEFVSNEVTALENNELTTIYAENGRIFGAENARIYDILGKDVTKDNGSLKGVFVVKFGNAATKIVVR